MLSPADIPAPLVRVLDSSPLPDTTATLALLDEPEAPTDPTDEGEVYDTPHRRATYNTTDGWIFVILRAEITANGHTLGTAQVGMAEHGHIDGITINALDNPQASDLLTEATHDARATLDTPTTQE